jgi:hypothetical protein
MVVSFRWLDGIPAVPMSHMENILERLDLDYTEFTVRKQSDSAHVRLKCRLYNKSILADRGKWFDSLIECYDHKVALRVYWMGAEHRPDSVDYWYDEEVFRDSFDSSVYEQIAARFAGMLAFLKTEPVWDSRLAEVAKQNRQMSLRKFKLYQQQLSEA